MELNAHGAPCWAQQRALAVSEGADQASLSPILTASVLLKRKKKCHCVCLCDVVPNSRSPLTFPEDHWWLITVSQGRVWL